MHIKVIYGKEGKLANQSKVGPRRVDEKALHKTASLVEYKLIWLVYMES